MLACRLRSEAMSRAAVVGQVFPKRGYDAVRIVLAIVLLAAAGLKAHQLATEPVVGSGLLHSRPLLIAAVEFELFFGLWLLAGIWPGRTWLAALGCFILFACVAFWKALSGEASCGCFGRVPVNPWYTFVLDTFFVVALLLFRPVPRVRHSETRSEESPSSLAGEGKGERYAALKQLLRASVVVVAWLAVGIPAALAMGTYRETTLSDAGEVTADGKIIVLNPGSWVGKKFPLLDYIDIGGRLKEGKCLILLYHHDCPKCQEAIRNLPTIAGDYGAEQVAYVEMPPYSRTQTLLRARPEISVTTLR
jgi:hypothetical protein